MATDWSDPCAALEALRPAYYELLSGKRASQVHFADRSVTYTASSLPDLRVEMARLEGQCQAKTTGRPARSAITAGSRNPWLR